MFVLPSGLLGVLLIAAALVSCGDDPVDPIADCLAAADVTGPVVAIRGFEFRPDTLRVAPGSRVTWVNCERETADAHTSTADDGSWDSGFFRTGETFARDFPEPGTFPYHCVPHDQFMRGIIIVE